MQIILSFLTLLDKVLLMEHNQPPSLETLKEIRHLMERSSRFISLSGLSGVFAGIFSLAGAFVAYKYLGLSGMAYYSGTSISGSVRSSEIQFIILDALVIMILAVTTGIFLTTRKARKDGNSIFDNTARKLVVNFCIPLATGGLFCIALILHGTLIYIAPVMLIFYGLSLLHASSFTRSDIRFLGLAEIALGLASTFMLGYGFIFWTIGFGILHILYGSYMYIKYEK